MVGVFHDSGDLQLLTVVRDRLHPVHPKTGSHRGPVRCLHWDNRVSVGVFSVGV